MTEPRPWQGLADRLAAESLAAGDPTGWFDRLYAAGRAGTAALAWERDGPQPLLAQWTDEHPGGAGRSAIVVGCGLGADAEHLASMGYRTTAFDVAPNAIELAQERNPGTSVDYRVADLFDLPDRWRQAFDLVVDIYTVQALPPYLRIDAIGALAELVAPAGRLVEITALAEVPVRLPDGPPWPLTSPDLDVFVSTGLRECARDIIEADGVRRWRLELTRAD